jgi:hypothetical protein
VLETSLAIPIVISDPEIVRGACAALLLLTACAGSPPAPPDAQDEQCEGIPPRVCGVDPYPCPCCLSCGLGDGLCFGSPAQQQFGVGECRARPAAAVADGVTLTAFGDVGARIEGSFSASVVEAATNPTTVTLANGTFSVERVAFP